MKSSERSVSVWGRTTSRMRTVPLREDLEADICVVGAGIAGLSVAYELAREGRRVVVLDDDAVGAGETGQTTAHLSSAMDDRFLNLESLHGREGARLAYASNQAAIERIGQIAAQEEIDCDYVRVDGYLFLAAGDSPELLDRERAAAHRAGFTDVERLGRAPLTTFETGPCLRFPRQARFHPLKYLNGLVRCIHRDGGHVFTGSHVTEVHGGKEARVRTRDGRTVRAREAVVVATNSPMNDRFAIQTKLEPYRTYVIGARIQGGVVPDALYWDTGDPYHYVRRQPVDDAALLIVGGEDHRTGGGEGSGDPHARLEEWTRARFPVGPVEYRWSGQVLEPVDYVAYIGRNPLDDDNVFVVTGDSGQGITHGVLAGLLISDLVRGIENPWAKLYDPSRVTLKAQAVKEFVRTNLQVAGHYAEYLVGAPGEVESVEEIAPGCGAVLRRDGTPRAVYRDDDGVPHELSAICTHLGCIVHWNDREKSWDCPCHGSRFDPRGRVLNGPAASDLEPMREAGA